MLARPPAPSPRADALARWLLVVAAMVFAIVVVGGITRLTESGLSITTWKPVTGVLPPLTRAAWEAEFAGYRAIPQYRQLNAGMTLAAFQQIYFWEYLHRLLARGIGTVLALVLLAFWWRRAIPAGYGWRTLLILALGGLQGAIGWWMVASGLEYRTEVSHVRLAVHLSAALLIYGVLIWTALDLLALGRGGAVARVRPAALAAIGVLAGQIVLGAFTAGLRAGYAFSSWPDMGGAWFPAGGWHEGWSGFRNLVDNPVVVQFAHRWWAWAAAAAVGALALACARAGARGPAAAIPLLVALQIALGIATLLSGVDIRLAVAHQATAAALLAATVWGAHAVGAAPRPARVARDAAHRATAAA